MPLVTVMENEAKSFSLDGMGKYISAFCKVLQLGCKERDHFHSSVFVWILVVIDIFKIGSNSYFSFFY